MIVSPLHPSEDRRMEALYACRLLDTEPEPVFDRLTALASSIASSPIALFSLIDVDRQWFKSRHGLAASETPRDFAFCAHAILSDEPLIVPDATVDSRFHDNPLVTGEPYVRFYAGFPIRSVGNQPIGTLCVIDQKPRQLTPNKIVELSRLAEILEADVAKRLTDMVRVAMRLNLTDIIDGVYQEAATTVAGLLSAHNHLGRTQLTDEQRALLAACQDAAAHIVTLIDHTLRAAESSPT